MPFEFNNDFVLWLKDVINGYREKHKDFLPSCNEAEFIDNVKNILDLYKEKESSIHHFGRKILRKFQYEKELFGKIHSYSFRLKDKKHLAEKIIRKKIERPHINIKPDNFFTSITDLAGLRLLQLYKTDIQEIHAFICNCRDWQIARPPVAYNFSPRFVKIFQELQVEVMEKPTGYSSSHYVLKNPEDSDCYCEVQVRTLFEEGWSEIDHAFNYPAGEPGKISRSLLKTLKRVCDVAIYIADQIPDIYKAEKQKKDLDELDFSVTLVENTLVRNLETDLGVLKDKIKHYSDFLQ
jgi:ppGpp synthetase/RelA/SpoT-type nucleotidyltranferase